MPRKEGWNGRVFEDFEVGEVYEHALGRTVTTADNIWFTALTMNPNPIHFDHAYAQRTDWKKPLVNSCLTLGLITGLSVADISQNGVNLGWDEVRMPKPVFEGDTLYARTEVLEKRESRSKENVGIVTIRTRGINQRREVVLEYRRTFMVFKRGAPEVADSGPGG